MPELPEAETICRSLRPRIKGKLITDIKLLWPSLLKGSGAEDLERWKEARLVQIRRRGKMILFDSDRGETMLFHLKMTGQLYLCSEKEPLDKHIRLILRFEDGKLELRFRDPRKFGYIKIFETLKEREVQPLAQLGPEPLELSLSAFLTLFKKPKGKIKPLLLRQNFIAGLGNIYSDEILYRARINPKKLVPFLSKPELVRLYKAMIHVLGEAIKLRGTSVRNYRDGLGKIGSFQNHLRVYGREGLPCYRCHQPIRREKIGGRSAFFCSQCQTL